MADEKLRFDPAAMTVGDMEDFEDVVGVGIDVALSPQTVRGTDGEIERDEKGRPVKAVRLSAKAIKALVWIIKRAEDENFTLDDARNVRVGELELFGSSDESPADEEKDDAA